MPNHHDCSEKNLSCCGRVLLLTLSHYYYYYYDRPTLQAFIDKFNFLAPKLARMGSYFICSIDSNGQGGMIKHKKKKKNWVFFCWLGALRPNNPVGGGGGFWWVPCLVFFVAVIVFGLDYCFFKKNYCFFFSEWSVVFSRRDSIFCWMDSSVLTRNDCS